MHEEMSPEEIIQRKELAKQICIEFLSNFQKELYTYYRTKYGVLPPALVSLHLQSYVGVLSDTIFTLSTDYKSISEKTDILKNSVSAILIDLIQICSLYDIKLEDLFLNPASLYEPEPNPTETEEEQISVFEKFEQERNNG